MFIQTNPTQSKSSIVTTIHITTIIANTITTHQIRKPPIKNYQQTMLSPLPLPLPKSPSMPAPQYHDQDHHHHPHLSIIITTIATLSPPTPPPPTNNHLGTPDQKRKKTLLKTIPKMISKPWQPSFSVAIHTNHRSPDPPRPHIIFCCASLNSDIITEAPHHCTTVLLRCHCAVASSLKSSLHSVSESESL